MKQISLFFTSLITSSIAFACLHYPVGLTEPLKEGIKHVFLYHDGKKAHMIVNTDVSLNSGSRPETIAWVLPFPSKPSKYEEVDGAIFAELKDLLKKPVASSLGDTARKGFGGAEAPKGIKLHKIKYVGRYKIQPIEILTEDSGKELSQWLEKNGFNPMPDEKQKPYLKKGAFFLAVQLKLGKTKQDRFDLKPLHIVYSAETLSFPLRFTHDTRVFGIELFVFSPYNIKTSNRETQTYIPEKYLTEVTSSHYNKKEMNKRLYPALIKRLGKLDGYLYRFTGEDLNSPGKLLSEMDRDPFINPLL